MTVTYPTAPATAPVMRPGRLPEEPGRVELDRLARVEELRAAILDETYEVPAIDVADAMIAFVTRS